MRLSKYRRRFITLSVLLVAAFYYQNCAPAKFGSKAAPVGAQGSTSTTLSGSTTTVPGTSTTFVTTTTWGSTTSTTVVPPPTTTTPPLACSGGRFAISSGSIIPANNACYYYKLINTVPTQTSCDVYPLSPLNYDLTYFSGHEGGTSPCTPKPRNMAKGNLIFTLASSRRVWISGDMYGSQNVLYVDNFLVFRFSNGTNKQYWAGGTADAFDLNTSHPYNVTINGSTIPYYEFAASGTTALNPPNLTSLLSISPNITYTLDAWAEDSGAVGNVSDVYVIFD